MRNRTQCQFVLLRLRQKGIASLLAAAGCVCVGAVWFPGAAAGQQILSLDMARAAARARSPAMAAARAGAEASAGIARQAAAFPNPSLSWSHEQTARGSASNAQNIFSLEQRIELATRSARTDAALDRQRASELRLDASLRALDFNVAEAWTNALLADRRATLADSAAAHFREAQRITLERLNAGDVSGYEARRMALETARYEALAAQAQGEAHRARLQLAALTGDLPNVALPSLTAVAYDDTWLDLPADSLVSVAVSRSPELRAAVLERQAAQTEHRLVRNRRIPVPLVSVGYKNERAIGSSNVFRGFVAGVSLSIPLWDRAGGEVDAAAANARRGSAHADVLLQAIIRQTRDAREAALRTKQQAALLRPQLGDEARAALLAAETAYGEGEIGLLEFLDTMRAYREAESAFAAVLAESILRRAALEQLLGVSILQ